MNGISNIFDASEVWNDEDLNLFLNLQTPIHKKKDDLLFPHDDLESSPSLSELSISPLIPMKAASNSTKSITPPLNSNDSNSSKKPPKLVPTKEVKTSSQNCINSETIRESFNSNQQQQLNNITKSVPITILKQNDENAKPQNSGKQEIEHPSTQTAAKPMKQFRFSEPNKEVKKQNSPKKSKPTKKPNLKKESISTQQQPPKKQKNPKEIPILPSPILPPSKQTKTISPIPKPINNQRESLPQTQSMSNNKQEETSQNKNQPPPLPTLPPQQLILKLFEEKQKRFFNRFEDDSLSLIDFISNYSIL